MTSSIVIPPLPVAQVRALALVSNPDPTYDQLRKVVDADPALTAALLRAANSAISAPVDRVRTAQVAMVRVGVTQTRRIVLGVALSSSFQNLHQSKIDEHEIWRHLIATGVLADATAWGEVQHTEAFTAGLLHDIGRLAMAAQDPLRYARVADLARRGTPASDAERTVFGMNHVDWGEAIARSWNFPADIVQAIAEHHIASQHGISWAVTRARELAGALGIGDGIVGPVAPPPDSEAAMLPVIEQLGGEATVLARVDWYSGALTAA
ncbi:MAG: HDOD domain-containing protein [Dehalococcoidia bacterium]|nr:HDOD domain-containing protein [Dehalococcoidia bacterium]